MDLENYGKYLYNNNFVEVPQTFNNKDNDLKLLKNKFFKNNDVKNRINYLNTEFIKASKYTLSQKIFGIKYKMLKKGALDELYNKCIDFVINHIDKLI